MHRVVALRARATASVRAHVHRPLVLTAAACLAVMTVSCSSAIPESAAPSSDETPHKADLTQVTNSMFVDRSAVPANLPMRFAGPSIRNDTGPNPPVYPSECGPIFSGPADTQSGDVKWATVSATGEALNADHGGYLLSISVPRERPDLKSLLSRCASIEHEGVTATYSPLPAQGLPDWAVATRVATRGATGADIMGYCRGLYISANFIQRPAADMSPTDTDTLVKLFNEQAAKLEAI
ncbi:hypothetical protein [Mycobacterium sp. OAE908]|uniref:hypothetical protein n=1 Tax=Mycobacterium sp. OAE908 TaxID=2817899 RepID=UPI001AE82DB2